MAGPPMVILKGCSTVLHCGGAPQGLPVICGPNPIAAGPPVHMGASLPPPVDGREPDAVPWPGQLVIVCADTNGSGGGCLAVTITAIAEIAPGARVMPDDETETGAHCTR